MRTRTATIALLLSMAVLGCGKQTKQELVAETNMKSVKIRVLPAPPSDLSSFDPGKYLSELEFYESPDAITETDRDGLAQMVHYLGFLALDAKSSKWETSVIPKDTLAFRALQSHFGHLSGWKDTVGGENELGYRQLASFLMEPYPPHRPKKN